MTGLELPLDGGALKMWRSPDGTYRLTADIILERDLDAIFEFSSSPRHLDRITPRWLTLAVKDPEAVRMATGTRIKYRLRIRRIPARWHSEVVEWDPPYRFTYRQYRGPFRSWLHEHTFERAGSRTLARDVIEYRVPGGRWVHDLFVGPHLRRLFTYRHQRLKELLAL